MTHIILYITRKNSWSLMLALLHPNTLPFVPQMTFQPCKIWQIQNESDHSTSWIYKCLNSLLFCSTEIHFPWSISTKALPVARNGLQRIIGTSKSTSESRITKPEGNMNVSTLLTHHEVSQYASSPFDKPFVAAFQWALGHLKLYIL